MSFSFASHIALRYSFGTATCLGVPCTGCLCHCVQLRFLSLLCPVGVLFLVLSPRLCPQLCIRRQLSVSGRIAPCIRPPGSLMVPLSHFGEKLVYASFLLYDFSGSPGGQPEGGFGHPCVGLRVTLPLCTLQAPLGCGAIGRETLKYLLSHVFFPPLRFVLGLFSLVFFCRVLPVFGCWAHVLFRVGMLPVASFSLSLRRASASTECMETEGRDSDGVI